MAVLIGLIILDLILVAVVMYFVLREPEHQAPVKHPYALEDEALQREDEARQMQEPPTEPAPDESPAEAPNEEETTEARQDN
jgi:hypothetical protein